MLSIADNSITIESEGDIVIKGDKIMMESTSGDIEVKSAGKVGIEASTELSAEGGTDLKLKAGVGLKAESTTVEVKGSGSAKLSGTQTTVEGSAMLDVKGGLGKIN